MKINFKEKFISSYQNVAGHAMGAYREDKVFMRALDKMDASLSELNTERTLLEELLILELNLLYFLF